MSHLTDCRLKLIRCAQEIVKYGQLVAKLSREIADKVLFILK